MIDRRPARRRRSLRHLVTDVAQRVARRCGLYVTPLSTSDDVRTLLTSLAAVASPWPLVELGRQGDGSYVVPDDLDGIVTLVSAGVGTETSFDKAVVERGVPCHLIDGTIDRSPLVGEGVTFDRRLVGPTSKSGHDAVRLDDLLLEGRIPAQGDLILQMDVEGDEWSILRDVSRAALRRFRIVIVEFHDITRASSAHLLPAMQQSVDVLLRDFVVVASRDNPVGGSRRHGDLTVPRLLEVTFHRRDRHDVARSTRSDHLSSAEDQAITSSA